MEEAKIGTREPAQTEYAFVDVVGGKQHAGRISEVEQFGTKMLRIDVPKQGDFSIGCETFFYGGAAIALIRLTDFNAVHSANKSPAPPVATSMPIASPAPKVIQGPEYTDSPTISVPAAGKKYFDLSRNGSYEAAKRGEIPTIKVGRKWRVSVAAMERLMRGEGR